MTITAMDGILSLLTERAARLEWWRSLMGFLAVASIIVGIGLAVAQVTRVDSRLEIVLVSDAVLATYFYSKALIYAAMGIAGLLFFGLSWAVLHIEVRHLIITIELEQARKKTL